jgi:hypothetical protein
MAKIKQAAQYAEYRDCALRLCLTAFFFGFIRQFYQMSSLAQTALAPSQFTRWVFPQGRETINLARCFTKRTVPHSAVLDQPRGDKPCE